MQLFDKHNEDVAARVGISEQVNRPLLVFRVGKTRIPSVPSFYPSIHCFYPYQITTLE